MVDNVDSRPSLPQTSSSGEIEQRPASWVQTLSGKQEFADRLASVGGQDVAMLHVDNRTFNVLFRKGLRQVEQIAALPPDELLSLGTETALSVANALERTLALPEEEYPSGYLAQVVRDRIAEKQRAAAHADTSRYRRRGEKIYDQQAAREQVFSLALERARAVVEPLIAQGVTEPQAIAAALEKKGTKIHGHAPHTLPAIAVIEYVLNHTGEEKK